MDQLPELPEKFQNHFEAAKAKAELEYAKRAERFPNQPHLAESGLEQLILVQRVFFAFCTAARNACREGVWAVTLVRQSVDAAWPLICDSYFARERGVGSEETKQRVRLETWRTVADDQRWKEHLSDFAALTCAALISPAASADGEAVDNSQPAVEGRTGGTAEFQAQDWSEVRIAFFSEHFVQISVGLTKTNRQYGELGMGNQRNGKPNLAWQTLHDLALSKGTINCPTGKARDWRTVEKRMQELRAWLRERFGISSDPLPFVKRIGYRAQFAIDCAPSYQR